MSAFNLLLALALIFHLSSAGYIWVYYPGCLEPWENNTVRHSCRDGVCADETLCVSNITRVGSFVVSLAMALSTHGVPCLDPTQLCKPDMILSWLQEHNAFTNPPADSPIQTNVDVLVNNFGIEKVVFTKDGYFAHRDEVYNYFQDTPNIVLIKLKSNGTAAYTFVTDIEKGWFGDDKPINYTYTLYNPLRAGSLYIDDHELESAYIFERKKKSPSSFMA